MASSSELLCHDELPSQATDISAIHEVDCHSAKTSVERPLSLAILPRIETPPIQGRRSRSVPSDYHLHASESPPRPIYQPLNARQRELRLLTLDPGTGHEPLVASLETHSVPLGCLLVLQNQLRRLNGGCSETREELSMVLANAETVRATLRQTLRTLQPTVSTQWVGDQLGICIWLSRCLVDVADRTLAETTKCGAPGSMVAETEARLAEHYKSLQIYLERGKDVGVEAIAPYQRCHVYDCVSYCWTSPRERATILLNGSMVQVPRSATEVLYRFREPTKARRLWIDANCIDQQNETEKASQVAMMGDIYRFATRTLVWLGEYEDELSEDALLWWRMYWKLFIFPPRNDFKLYLLGRGTLCSSTHRLYPSDDHHLDGALVVLIPLERTDCASLSIPGINMVIDLLSEEDSDGGFNAEEIAAIERSIHHLRRELEARSHSMTAGVRLRADTGLPEVDRSSQIHTFLENCDQDWIRSCLSSLCHLPQYRWFSRLWTYQEACNSSNLDYYIGEDVLSSEAVSTLVSWFLLRSGRWRDEWPLNTYTASGSALLTAALRAELAPGIDKPVTSLWDLAVRTRSLGCSNPRDKIFALLSMASDQFFCEALPAGLLNYKQSVADCMCRATKAMLQEGCSLDILKDGHGVRRGFGSRSCPDGSRWPSWCPRWDLVCDYTSDDLSMDWKIVPEPMACGSREFDLQLLEDLTSTRHLVVEGNRIGKIAHCCQDVFCGDLGKMYTSNPDLSHHAKLALAVNVLVTNQLSAEEIAMDMCKTPGDMVTAMYSCLQDRALLPCLESHGEDCRLYIREGRGFVGLGPVDAQPGDDIVILSGASVPFVLRQQKDYHLMIGYCYESSVIDGSAAESWQRRGISPRKFELR